MITRPMTKWFEADVRLYTEWSQSSFRPIKFDTLEGAIAKAEEYIARWGVNCIVDVMEFNDDGSEPVPYFRDSNGEWKRSKFASSFRV